MTLFFHKLEKSAVVTQERLRCSMRHNMAVVDAPQEADRKATELTEVVFRSLKGYGIAMFTFLETLNS